MPKKLELWRNTRYPEVLIDEVNRISGVERRDWSNQIVLFVEAGLKEYKKANK